MCTTSHNHSPKQAQASDTKEQENQQTRQKASCIARGENQFPTVCITSFQLFALWYEAIATRVEGDSLKRLKIMVMTTWERILPASTFQSLITQ